MMMIMKLKNLVTSFVAEFSSIGVKYFETILGANSKATEIKGKKGLSNEGRALSC